MVLPEGTLSARIWMSTIYIYIIIYKFTHVNVYVNSYRVYIDINVYIIYKWIIIL